MKTSEPLEEVSWDELQGGILVADDDGPGFGIMDVKPRENSKREAELDSFDRMMRGNRGLS